MPLLFVLFFAYGIAATIAGFQGIDHHLGVGWAVAAVAAAFALRFTLPLSIGAFFGAADVWGWHWFFALVFAVPGLAFMIPAVIMSITGREGEG